jgi:hypothetical protein
MGSLGYNLGRILFGLLVIITGIYIVSGGYNNYIGDYKNVTTLLSPKT